jgi:hypothetical protein
MIYADVYAGEAERPKGDEKEPYPKLIQASSMVDGR